MKKYISIFIMCLMFSVTFAQSTVTNMAGNGATLTDAGTGYVTLAPSLFYDQVSFQAKITKVSGTIAGTAILQWSNDNTNFINTDTLTFSNQTTNTSIFVKTYNPAYYYRIKFTGSGTMSGTIYGYCLTGNGYGKRLVSNMTQAYGSTSDTTVNAATGYVGITLSNYYTRVSFQAVVTKISGTVAGTVTLQGSNDGTNYVTVSSSYATATTLSCTDQTTNTKMFVVTGSPYKYYRLSYTGSGTMSATIKGYCVPNR